MDAIFILFKRIVREGFMPKPFFDTRYRMTHWHKFVLDALVAMADD